MSEPVPGISAVPDEKNARYFHVVVDGPSDVSLSFLFACILITSLNHTSHLMKAVPLHLNFFYRKSIQWRLQRSDLWQKYIIQI